MHGTDAVQRREEIAQEVAQNKRVLLVIAAVSAVIFAYCWIKEPSQKKAHAPASPIIRVA